MANLGLLGALAGLGEGMVKVGQNMERRREEALKWAREEAQRQEAARIRREEREEDRISKYALALSNQRAHADRSTFQAENQQKRDTARYANQERIENIRQDNRANLEEKRQRNRERLLQLREQMNDPEIVETRTSVERQFDDGTQLNVIYGRRREGGWFKMGQLREYPRSTNSSGGGSSGGGSALEQRIGQR